MNNTIPAPMDAENVEAFKLLVAANDKFLEHEGEAHRRYAAGDHYSTRVKRHELLAHGYYDRYWTILNALPVYERITIAPRIHTVIV